MTQPSLTRREFLQSTAVAGTGAAFGHVTPSLIWASPTDAGPTPLWASKPMRWAQLTLVEDDPAHFDIGFWLDYFKRTQVRRRLPQRGRLRRFLSHRGSLSPSQRVARRPRCFRRTHCGLPQARHVRARPHRSACDLRRREDRASGLDRGRCAGQSAPPLGLAGDVGDLRAWAVQFRLHDGRAQRDHVALSRRWHLHEPLGRLRRLLLRALPRQLQGCERLRPSALDRSAGPGEARLLSVAAAAAHELSSTSGTPRSARSIRSRA